MQMIGRPKRTEADLRQSLAATEARLRAIDQRLDAASRDRDEAQTRIDALTSRAAPPAVDLWDLEDARDAAMRDVAELLAERRPVARDVARLRSIVEPIDAHRRQIAELAAAAEGGAVLLQVVEEIAKVPDLIDRARDAVRESAGVLSLKPSIEELDRRIRGRWTESLVPEIRGEVESIRRRLAELQSTEGPG